MFTQARKYMEHTWDFLDTLDCYISTQGWMAQEVADFGINPQRQIAALVCQNIPEKLTYPAPYIRILYVLSGEVRLWIDNKTLDYEAGCLIMANEHTRLDYQQKGENVEVVNFLFKKEYFTDNLLSLIREDSIAYRFFTENAKADTERSNFSVYQFHADDDIHFYCMLLLKQVVKMRYEHNRMTLGSFLLLVNEVNRLSAEHLQLKDSSLSPGILIWELLAEIEHSFSHITLSSLAEKYYFHPNYLSSFIHEQTGKTFSELLVARRLRQAQTYLEQTELTVWEIIQEVGYSDKTYFHKLFKAHFGCTPAQYRKQYKTAQAE